MILIAAENQELALSISINQRNPHRTPKNPARGYYLALTFGTLLSSQRADARKLHPHGLRVRPDVPHYAGFRSTPHPGPRARRPSRAARRMKNHTPPAKASAGGPYRQPEQ